MRQLKLTFYKTLFENWIKITSLFITVSSMKHINEKGKLNLTREFPARQGEEKDSASLCRRPAQLWTTPAHISIDLTELRRRRRGPSSDRSTPLIYSRNNHPQSIFTRFLFSPNKYSKCQACLCSSLRLWDDVSKAWVFVAALSCFELSCEQFQTRV